MRKVSVIQIISRDAVGSALRDMKLIQCSLMIETHISAEKVQRLRVYLT